MSLDPILAAAPEVQPRSGARLPGRELPVFLEIGLTVLSLLNLAMVGWVELRDIPATDAQFRVFADADMIMVTVFIVEYLVRLRLAESKRSFLRGHWYDLPAMIPLYLELLPWFGEAGAFRFLRLIRLFRLLRAVPALRRFYHSVDFVRRVISESNAIRLLSVVAVGLILASLGFWVAEKGKSVRDFDDALWCAVSTFTTAGFVPPETGAGRFLASVLMLLGMGTGTAFATLLVTAALRVGDSERPLRQLEVLRELRADGILDEDQYQRARQDLIQGALDDLRAVGVLSKEEAETAKSKCAS